MKQFMISNFDEHDGLYHIWFGNRICVKFASKRDMAAFLADTNRFLTSSMVELNEFYISIFTQYRNMWFTMMNYKTGTTVNMLQDERHLQKLIDDIMDQFNRCGNTAHGTASGAWAFIHLQNICLMMGECLEMLIEINKKRNNTYTYHSLQTLSNRIKSLEKTICNYPEVLPVNAVEMKSNK
jgi:hypothetical protein